MNGIIVIDKPKGITSRDVVNQVGKTLNTKKVGHTGTLDPLATGVLVLCIGTATKLTDIIVAEEKEYIAKVILGIHTDTLDITGEVLERKKVELKEEEIIKAINSMKGSYLQEVPIYSAIKINGQKLYEYARERKEVELPKRMVTVSQIEYLNDLTMEKEQMSFSFKCTVSKGTYIRSLIRDIAKKLNTIGVMAELKRTSQGNYRIEQAVSIEQIKEGNYTLLPIQDALKNYLTIKANKELSKKIKYGQVLDQNYESDHIVFIDENNQLLAIYQKYEKDPSKIKPWKMF